MKTIKFINFLIDLQLHSFNISNMETLDDILFDTPSPEPDASAPQTPKRRLTRDQRRDILLLHSLNWTYEQIATKVKTTHYAVQYTCQKQVATPVKQPGRPSQLSSDQVDEILDFITATKEGRQMAYKTVVTTFELGVSDRCLGRALKKRGFSRCVALRKPPISEKNRVLRLAFAQKHRDKGFEWWSTILWTDETWVNGGRHRKTYVTRMAGEELDPTCLIEKIQRKKGWMFWGSINGAVRGPSLFWEKEWGNINKDSYQEKIVPLVDGWIRMNPGLVLMQDNAPGHAAKDTQDELHSCGIVPIQWPPYSPDLNPIETIWNIMKDWIAAHYGSENNPTYD